MDWLKIIMFSLLAFTRDCSAHDPVAGGGLPRSHALQIVRGASRELCVTTPVAEQEYECHSWLDRVFGYKCFEKQEGCEYVARQAGEDWLVKVQPKIYVKRGREEAWQEVFVVGGGFHYRVNAAGEIIAVVPTF